MRSVNLGRLCFLLFLTACSALNIPGQFTSGRQALIRGDAATAVDRFQRVAGLDPNYQVGSVDFRQSIWTYLGRAQYSLGNLPAAKESLEKALSVERRPFGEALSRFDSVAATKRAGPH
jgi:hypothetical protein